jgi:hypothetical protein
VQFSAIEHGEGRGEEGREGKRREVEEERRYSLVESESKYKGSFILKKEGERDRDAM